MSVAAAEAEPRLARQLAALGAQRAEEQQLAEAQHLQYQRAQQAQQARQLQDSQAHIAHLDAKFSLSMDYSFHHQRFAADVNSATERLAEASILYDQHKDQLRPVDCGLSKQAFMSRFEQHLSSAAFSTRNEPKMLEAIMRPAGFLSTFASFGRTLMRQEGGVAASIRNQALVWLQQPGAASLWTDKSVAIATQQYSAHIAQRYRARQWCTLNQRTEQQRRTLTAAVHDAGLAYRQQVSVLLGSILRSHATSAGTNAAVRINRVTSRPARTDWNHYTNRERQLPAAMILHVNVQQTVPRATRHSLLLLLPLASPVTASASSMAKPDVVMQKQVPLAGHMQLLLMQSLANGRLLCVVSQWSASDGLSTGSTEVYVSSRLASSPFQPSCSRLRLQRGLSGAAFDDHSRMLLLISTDPEDMAARLYCFNESYEQLRADAKVQYGSLLGTSQPLHTLCIIPRRKVRGSWQHTSKSPVIIVL